MRPFEPILRNPHLLTILGNFWPRNYETASYPIEHRLVLTDGDTQVLVQTQRPVSNPTAQIVFVHGLEGGGESGYIRSMAWHALEASFVTHRFHMRTCGGTEKLCRTLYHGGLTSDLRAFVESHRDLPLFLIGFSLGGNVSLKLAGELGATDLIQGVCAISTPIDLGACSRALGRPENRLYERRFVNRMKQRLLATGRYSPADLSPYQSLYEIDDKITAPSFGFGTADRYYATQSSAGFLDRIRVPTLVVQAKDDPFIPFDIFSHPAFSTNPHLRLLATEHGGHLGFLARSGQRFWIDEVALSFVKDLARVYA